MVYLYEHCNLIVHVQAGKQFIVPWFYSLLKNELPNFVPIIEGLRLLSFREKNFLITFEKDSSKSNRTVYTETFHDLCKDGFQCSSDYSGTILKTTLPSHPYDVISLYPCPFEMDDDHFLQIVGSNHWGTLMKVTYGKLRNAPQIKNGYVNIHLKDTYMDNIKSRIKAFGHWLTVTKPHEAHLPLCNYCKERGHSVRECPKIANKRCSTCNQTGHDPLHCSERPQAQRVGEAKDNDELDPACSWSLSTDSTSPSGRSAQSGPGRNDQTLPTSNMYETLEDEAADDLEEEEDEFSNDGDRMAEHQSIDNVLPPQITFGDFLLKNKIQIKKSKRKKHNAKKAKLARNDEDLVNKIPSTIQANQTDPRKETTKASLVEQTTPPPADLKPTSQMQTSENNVSLPQDVINKLLQILEQEPPITPSSPSDISTPKNSDNYKQGATSDKNEGKSEEQKLAMKKKFDDLSNTDTSANSSKND